MKNHTSIFIGWGISTAWVEEICRDFMLLMNEFSYFHDLFRPLLSLLQLHQLGIQFLTFKS
jgi:hypothetical protein